MKSITTDIQMYIDMHPDLNEKLSSLTPREVRGLLAALKLALSELDERAKDDDDRAHLEKIIYKRLHSFDAIKFAKDVTPKQKELTYANPTV